MPQLSLARLSLIVLVSASVFLTGLGSCQLWDRDEPRNARAAIEMLSRGDWTVPTFNNELRAHKPVLLYWGQMVSYLSLGQSEFTARLPSALAAIVSVFSIAVLASRLSGNRRGINSAGFWSATALATCLFMVMAGRAATPDSLLIATSTLGITFLVIASIAPAAPYSSGNVSAARWLPAALAYTSLGFAALAKGPVGIVLPLAVVHGWWMINKRLESIPVRLTAADSSASPSTTQHSLLERGLQFLKGMIYETWHCFNPLSCWRAIWALRTIPGLILSLLVATPWYVAVGIETDGEFLRGFFIDHNLGRALNTMEGHHGTVAFYPAAFLVGTFPWSLWFIPIAAWCFHAYRENAVQRQLVVLGLVWVYVYVGGFTLASTKLPSYITPCYPGAALIIGSYLKQFESVWNMPRRSWRIAANGLATVLGCIIVAGIVVASRIEHMPGVVLASGCGAAIALVGIAGLVLERMQRPQWMPVAWLIAAVMFQINLFSLGAHQVGLYREDTRLIQSTQQHFPSEHWMSVGTVEPSYVYYLGQSIVELTNRNRQDSVWKQVQERFSRFPDSRLILMGDAVEEFEAMASNYAEEMPQITELARAKRFLKPGQVAIYSLNPEANRLRMAEQPAATTSMSR
jgi:4-amino-4-deoxy-L-arabinose transferase-like glycosyltransferase